jgi:hypothetical protein
VSGKERIARRIAREFKDGFYVNLGIGLPTMIAAYLPAGIDVVFQSENGMLGVGPPPAEGQANPDLVNAGKQPVTELPGCSYFASEESFAMIRQDGEGDGWRDGPGGGGSEGDRGDGAPDKGWRVEDFEGMHAAFDGNAGGA